MSPVIIGEVLVEKKKGKNGNCVCEERIRAFMTMLRVGEGTLDDGGYERIVGGSSFSENKKDYSDHPNVRIWIPRITDYSTAAGAYQITYSNWIDYGFKRWRDNNNLNDFSKENQDIYCYYLIKFKKKALNEIKTGEIIKAIELCKKEWASLPGAGYNQREESLSTVLEKYEEFYNNELNATSKLQVPIGFFRDRFREVCKCGAEDKEYAFDGINISKYITYERAIYSKTASDNKIDNSATEEHIKNMQIIGYELYDKIYEQFDGKIQITSMYRSSALNGNVKGASGSSQHLKGEAIDIQAIAPLTNKEIFTYIVNNLAYDQIIWEHGTEEEPIWIHVSYSSVGFNRLEKRRATGTRINPKYSDFKLVI